MDRALAESCRADDDCASDRPACWFLHHGTSHVPAAVHTPHDRKSGFWKTPTSRRGVDDLHPRKKRPQKNQGIYLFIFIHTHKKTRCFSPLAFRAAFSTPPKIRHPPGGEVGRRNQNGSRNRRWR